jgi:hydrogenase maturation protease
VSRILIIGYGNPLRGDDAFGWIAAERLRERIGDPDVEVLAVPQLLPELMEPIANCGRVIFIDACAAGEPGKLNCRHLEPDPSGAGAFLHRMSPEALLAGARTLYRRVPEAVMYTVRAERMAMGDELTPGIERALNQAVARIGAMCY